MALVSRYWTKLFTVFLFLSYILVYPFFIIYPLFDLGIGTYDVSQYGVAYAIFGGATFWFVIIICNLVSFGHRYVERGYVWLFRPQVLPPFLSPPPLCNMSLSSCDSHQILLCPFAFMQQSSCAVWPPSTNDMQSVLPPTLLSFKVNTD